MLSSLLAFTSPSIDFHSFAPEIVVLGVLVAVLLVDLFTDEGSPLAPSIASIGMLVALIPLITLATTDHEVSMFGGAYMVDNFALVMKALFIISGYLIILLSMNYIGEGDYWEGEYYQLIIASVLGMMVMASARDLISIFIALELLSIPAYMLAAWKKNAAKGNEAGIKYYLMGVFASAVMLYGMSLIYGLTGSTLLADIAGRLGSIEDTSAPIVTLAIVFVLVGFGFKVSAVPFHAWAPDTYEGAPTPVTAFFAAAPKVAAIALFTRLLIEPFGHLAHQWQQIIIVSSILSMSLGAFAAITQSNIKRLMAYSSIGHIGYALVGLASGTQEGVRGVLIYMAVYIVMNIGTFAVILCMRQQGRMVEEIKDLAGLSRTNPLLAGAMAVFMFSMAGIPPMAGFFSKLYVFLAAIEAQLYTLAVIGVLTSVVGAYYYLRIIKIMYFDEPVESFDKINDDGMTGILVATGLFTLLFFVVPAPILNYAASAAASLFAG